MSTSKAKAAAATRAAATTGATEGALSKGTDQGVTHDTQANPGDGADGASVELVLSSVVVDGPRGTDPDAGSVATPFIGDSFAIESSNSVQTSAKGGAGDDADASGSPPPVIDLARAVVIFSGSGVRFPIGELVEGPQSLIDRLSRSHDVDPHPGVVAHAEAQGATVNKLEG